MRYRSLLQRSTMVIVKRYEETKYKPFPVSNLASMNKTTNREGAVILFFFYTQPSILYHVLVSAFLLENCTRKPAVINCTVLIGN